MVASSEPLFQSERDLREEINELRRGLLPMFLPLMIGVAWLWFAFSILRSYQPGLSDLPAVVALIMTYVVYALGKRHHILACCALLLGMIFVQSLIMLVQPVPLLMILGILVVIAAHALVGTLPAILVAALVWGASITTIYLKTGILDLSWSAFGILAAYYLALGASWVAARPFNTTIHWALSGWEYANAALTDTRQRRAELHRVVRALEEATYRIERMNNELIVARREAEEARALKARLAATVSHELRGPLNLILGFSRLMALSPESYKEPLPPAYRTDVHTIYRNSQHLLSLVDDILDLSQIEAQRLPLVKDRIDMEEDVVKKVVDIVQPLAERKGLYLNQVLAGGLPWVLADGVRLRQALLNMLTNAVRFTERGGITVSTGRNDDRLLVSVRDTGPGIAPEDLPKLFKEFAQVSRQAESREEGGSGLGLSISKHLIELHGGEIWAESQKGLGTTFHFTVPLPGTEPIALATIRTEDLKQRMASQQSCLIVHDDPDIVRLLARYIEGYRVIGLPDERAVLTLTEELHPRAIIATPELAAEITERLSHLPFDIPIVSCAMPRMRERTYLQGVFSYLVKPIMPEMLTAVMKQVERDGETTVLLVDDDPDVVRLLERMLTMLPRSYKVLKAYDGLEALEVMQDELPDVVFLDLVMPALDGEQVVSRMREDERLRNVPVVIISARDRIEGKAALETPISVRCKRPVEVARAAKCLQALLDALNPSYLPEPEEPAQPALRSLEQSAFAALWPRPTPAPDAVG